MNQAAQMILMRKTARILIASLQSKMITQMKKWLILMADHEAAA